MSSQIDVSYVKQFSANVFHLSQQKGSRLQPLVRNETQKGDSAFYDRIGTVAAVLKTSRHSATPQMDTPHSRRRVTMNDYEWADLIDDQDKIRSLNDPTSDYAQAAMWALGRAKDTVIIDAASGSAYGGVSGGTAVTFPTTQKIHAVSGGALSGLNVGALRHAKRRLDEAEVDPSIPRYFVCQARQIENLLAQTEVTSSDFNTIKALVQGEVNTFMGFNFIRLQLLNLETGAPTFNLTTGAYDGGGSSANGNRRCLAFASNGLLLSTGAEVKGRVSERADLSYSTQVYASMSLGATRMEEEKVLEVYVDEP